jgi:hypothetical protein
MSSKPSISALQAESITRSLEEINNSVRGDGPTYRLPGLKSQQEEDVNKSIGELIDKVSATSIAEVAKLISDLQAVHKHLKAEGDRIQQQMARYAHMSDTVSASAKIITETLAEWRKEPAVIMTDNVRIETKRA